MNTLTIADCKVSKQLNGSTLFVVLQGTEQQITDAYNTLWNCNAISGDLEWLHGGLAVVVAKPRQLMHGLAYRELFRLMDNPDACKQFKGIKGGFVSKAEELAEQDFNAMQDVRVVTPQAAFAPYFYKMAAKQGASEWQTERPDATCE